MFNGLINYLNNILLLKYNIVSNFLILKVNKKKLDINIGDSVSINGVCLTVVYKNLYFFEFNFSYNTFINIKIFNNFLTNFEKSLKFLNNFDGYFLYGHNNNIFIMKNKFYFLDIIKIYIASDETINKLLAYKTSISVDGVSLTINELIKFKNTIFISLNILKYTYKFTSIKFLKIFNFINIELDLSVLFLLKFIN